MYERVVGAFIFGLLFLLGGYLTSFYLVINIILFLISLLTISKAPTSALWMVAVIVCEYSIYFAGITSLFVLISFNASSYKLLAIIIGLLALVLFLSPIFRAHLIAQKLPTDLNKAFRHMKNIKDVNELIVVNHQPFSIGKLIQSVRKASFRSLTYVTYEDKTLSLDFYPSTVAGKRPCVVVVHGGSWIRGDSKQLPELNSHLAHAGYHCAAINYRLAPRWKCPAPIEDVDNALIYLRNHADELNIDTDNFVLLGRSAGGQIVLLAAYTLQQPGIKGVIDFYGPADMIWAWHTPTNPLVLNSCKTLSTFIGGDYTQMPDKYAANSPIEFVNRQSVPTLMLHGPTDPLVFDEHSRRLAKKLQQYDIPNYYLEIPWGTHGFDYHLNGPSGQLSTYAVEYFLRVITGR